ncbi:MAG: hypothetical protein ABSA82_10090 [Thermacetogeniaceae bacterium]
MAKTRKKDGEATLERYPRPGFPGSPGYPGMPAGGYGHSPGHRLCTAPSFQQQQHVSPTGRPP